MGINPISSTPAAVPATAAQEFRQSWRLVLLATIAAFFSGLPWVTFGIFISPLSQAFGWSLAAITVWAFFFQGGSMAANLVAGYLADRVGVRVVGLVAIPFLALALFGASEIRGSVGSLYVAAFAVGCVGTSVALLIYGRAVNGWFAIARGRAFAVMAAGIGFSYIFGPRLVQAVADGFGWRNGFRFMAAIGLLAWPLAYFWLRERRDAGGRAARQTEGGHSLRHSIRLPTFWLLAAAYLLMGLSNGTNLHLMPFLTEGGMSRAAAATLIGISGLTSLFARLVSGWMVDRVHAALFCGFAVLLQAGAFLLLGLWHQHFALAAILMWGFALGTEIVCLGYCIARYFGLAAYGRVIALINVFWGVGVGCGPPMFGWLREAFGSYRTSFLIAAVLALASALLLALISRYPFQDLPEAPIAAGKGGP
jgi:predicted MFS family arabinose efflux permease